MDKTKVAPQRTLLVFCNPNYGRFRGDWTESLGCEYVARSYSTIHANGLIQVLILVEKSPVLGRSLDSFFCFSKRSVLTMFHRKTTLLDKKRSIAEGRAFKARSFDTKFNVQAFILKKFWPKM